MLYIGAGGDTSNEGRIRPSFIAACQARPPLFTPAPQRGSNSTLLHCGVYAGHVFHLAFDQRGSNSTLLHCGPACQCGWPCHRHSTRVEFDPPSLRRRHLRSDGLVELPTRVEFDPPSLRRRVQRRRATGQPGNEGRIRPSFIAATAPASPPGSDGPQRGSNSTLLHCGSNVEAHPEGGAANEGRIRPSFIAATASFWAPARVRRQRGSNSTLLHCGASSVTFALARAFGNEGRIRPSFIAANSLAVMMVSIPPSTRVEFDPPSLRPEG